jgi:hypothetical protein
MSFLAKMSLGSNEYTVLNADYEINQRMDQQNRPNDAPKAGIIRMIIESSNKNDILEWAISPSMMKTGKVVFFRRDAASSMKTLEFLDAFCVSYREVFDAANDNAMKIYLTLSARELHFNGSYALINTWPGSSSGSGDSGNGSGSNSSANSSGSDAGSGQIGSFIPN